MYYFIEPWDTLERIARKFGVSMAHLFHYNPIVYYQPTYVGQKLFIPLPDIRAMTSYTGPINDTSDSTAQKNDDTNNSTSNNSNNKYSYIIEYEVKNGDTIGSIAKSFNTTEEAIMKLNGLISPNFVAGDKLLINTSRKRALKETYDDQQIRRDKDLDPRSKYAFLYLHDIFLNKNINIWKEIGYKDTFFFVSKMAVTAAGAPNAFNKDNDLALDFIANAGSTGNWWSLVTEPQGYPMIQTEDDPFPGYYISKTVLSDCSKPEDDPTRYIDAREIPYIALPAHHMMGAEFGDLCAVINTQNGKMAYAVIADVGPDDSIGIGSIALAEDLGINSDAKCGGITDGILYIVFTQSGKEGAKTCYEECYNNCNENCEEICDKECYEKMENLWCKPKTREQINKAAQPIFTRWGGIEKVYALFGDFPLTHTNIVY